MPPEIDREWKEPSPAAGKGGARRRLGLWRKAVLLVVALFGLGFFVFANGVPRDEVKLERSAEGIVVLTGGALRIIDAVELLAAGHGKRLLISGVHPTTTPGELTRRSPELERLFQCCIDLGHEALNTTGNAIETGRWAHDHGFRSLIVVTSGWHMPRALIVLERELPGVVLIPYPVISERIREGPWWASVQTIRLFLVEYVKYVATYAHRVFDLAVTNASLLGGKRKPQS